MKKSYFKFYLSMLIAMFMASLVGTGAFSQQDTSEDKAEKREFAKERREEEAERMKPAIIRVTKAEEVIAILKEQAEARIKKRKRELLLKTRTSVSTTYKYETNPSAASDAGKVDHSVDESYAFSWIPTFNRALSADVGYSIAPLTFFEQTDLDTIGHTATSRLKWYAGNNYQLLIEPSFIYQGTVYPFDEQATYWQEKYGMALTYYVLKDVHYGGSYEYLQKFYPNRLVRQEDQQRLNYEREDHRNTYDLWIKWFRDKYSIRLKGKVYYNEGNEKYQNYDDYLSNKGEVTFAGSFLKDDRLYLSWTSGYEIKDYENRLADNSPRTDKTISHSFSAYYTLDKTFTLTLSYNWIKQKSNALSGKYRDILYSAGLIASF